ncbi:low molecular weight protein-tyrosine-phosphatase [Nevskia soli]|uniref:low molecular weight protein-tyrosine-phosphatase n=1 Tax=Nevskia soli TaxID=418856 RepID=UPI000A02585D|nr:low molecular weight protein-tyrosine-phosphatase [Nevskia soli]
MFHKIIVVCTGNICRSPIAEGLLNQRLQIENIQVCSAGTAALAHHPADPNAVLVAKENGLDISPHRGQQATQILLTSMDLILTLDQTHNEWIWSRFPHLRGRTHKLGRWRNQADIADPYRKPKAAFEQAFSEISMCVDDWITRIRPALPTHLP